MVFLHYAQLYTISEKHIDMIFCENQATLSMFLSTERTFYHKIAHNQSLQALLNITSIMDNIVYLLSTFSFVCFTVSVLYDFSIIC